MPTNPEALIRYDRSDPGTRDRYNKDSKQSLKAWTDAVAVIRRDGRRECDAYNLSGFLEHRVMKTDLSTPAIAIKTLCMLAAAALLELTETREHDNSANRKEVTPVMATKPKPKPAPKKPSSKKTAKKA